MPRTTLAIVLLGLLPAPGWALSGEAREFIEISRTLEPLQCEKRKLRREIALAQAEQRDSSTLRERFAALDRDPATAKLERRLAELAPRVTKSADPEDMPAISLQQRQAFYRCQ